MDVPSPEDWFDDLVGPTASVAAYAASPPRGMTWGPQNPKVRAQLAQELNELGVQLEHPSWPPPVALRFKKQVDQTGLDSTLARSQSSPLDSCGARYAPRGPHLKVIRRGAYGDVVDHTNTGKNRRNTVAAPKRIYSMGGGLRPAHKGYSRKADSSNQSSGLPTTIWRNVRVSLKSTEAAGNDARDPSSGSARGSAPRLLDDEELRNARDALKGQSSLHIAAVADRFHFAADMSAGAPLCIRGAGTSKPINSPAWTSDASMLINSHCGEMRRVAPSGLEANKDQPKKKKKKKKDDIDELQLSASGLFQSKYPMDTSVKALRQLKRDMFPELVQKEEEERARQKALEQAGDDSLASFFKNALAKSSAEARGFPPVETQA